MIAKAKLRFTRGSARKIRQVVDLIRNRDVRQALDILATTTKRSSTMLAKLLKSAIANAKNKGLKEEDLYISKIVADEAARWKRFRAAAFGRATEILKRTSHVLIELDLHQGNKKQHAQQPKTASKPLAKPSKPVAKPLAKPLKGRRHGAKG